MGESALGGDDHGHASGLDNEPATRRPPTWPPSGPRGCRKLALLRDCEPNLERVALLRLEGYRNHEIAAEAGCSVSTVERRLSLIRSLWEEDEEGA